jgi:hypothetical protein
MKKFFFNHQKIIFVILVGVAIAFLGYILRLQQFSSFPPVGDTEDEVKYAFNGLSLIQKKVPESWSWYDDYGQFETLHIRNSNYRLVKPYFDDPPLFALLSGAYALSKGMTTYEKVEAGALRWPMLKLGALNVFLLFLLVYFLNGFWTASIASLIAGTGEKFFSPLQVKIYQLLFPLMMAPFLFNELKGNLIFKRFCQIILVVVFILMIWFNIRTLCFFQDQFWY